MRESQLRAADRGLVAILSMFGALGLIGLAVLLALRQDNKAEKRLDPPHAFAQMANLAGPSAVDCGRVELTGDPTASVRCVEDAIREGRAFWMVRRNSFHPEHRMELHWYGFVRSDLGRQYVVIYYPPYSVASDSGSIATYSCPRIETHMRNGELGPTCVGGMVGPPYWFPCRIEGGEADLRPCPWVKTSKHRD
jgi:hypothetical protein